MLRVENLFCGMDSDAVAMETDFQFWKPYKQALEETPRLSGSTAKNANLNSLAWIYGFYVKNGNSLDCKKQVSFHSAET